MRRVKELEREFGSFSDEDHHHCSIVQRAEHGTILTAKLPGCCNSTCTEGCTTGALSVYPLTEERILEAIHKFSSLTVTSSITVQSNYLSDKAAVLLFSAYTKATHN